MNIDEIKAKVQSEEYNFLREKPLGDNVILLGLGGSYAYGTNNENSDIDIRGVATHSPEDILTRKGFDQVVNEATDTTVYSLEKIINLLSNCNPNTIEILGLEPWQYLYVSDVGQALIDNADMFLSKRAVHSFGGYANSQLRSSTTKLLGWLTKNKGNIIFWQVLKTQGILILKNISIIQKILSGYTLISQNKKIMIQKSLWMCR